METRLAHLLRAPKCGEQIGCADSVWERTRKRKRRGSLQWSEFGFA